jgi:hypothetical protein
LDALNPIPSVSTAFGWEAFSATFFATAAAFALAYTSFLLALATTFASSYKEENTVRF